MAFKEGHGGADAAGRHRRAVSWLVVSEIVLALVLLAGSGLLIRTFVSMRATDRGFDARDVLALDMSLAQADALAGVEEGVDADAAGAGTDRGGGRGGGRVEAGADAQGERRFDRTAAIDGLVRDVERRASAIPGLSAVAATTALPLDAGVRVPLALPRRGLFGSPYHGEAGWRAVSPGYFRLFAIPLRGGRLFGEQDTARAEPVVIISEAMARKYWPGADPIGERLTLGHRTAAALHDPQRRIVGIVADVRDVGLAREPEAEVYVPVAQLGDRATARNNRLRPLTWVVKTAVDPMARLGEMERMLRLASGGLPVGHVRLMADIVSTSTARADFTALLLTLFAALALLLAGVGLYGLMAWTVQQRARELGIRLALGARPRDLQRLVVRESLRLTLIGCAAGSALALALARLAVSLRFGVRPWDPLVFGTILAILLLVALLAAYVPARRTTRADPVRAIYGP